LTPPDEALLRSVRDLLPQLRRDFGQQAFHRALEAIWAVVGEGNRYVDEQAPWALRKSDPPRMGTVLYVVAEALRHLAILIQPVMPGSMSRLLDQLGVPESKRNFADLAEPLEPGTSLPEPAGVFPRYVEHDQAAM
jgi:methionyl-tRNA synthetase